MNDNPPEFSEQYFEWAITEVSPVNFTIGYLQAVDLDYKQEYIQMNFEIVSQVNS